MELIVISTPNGRADEIQILDSLFRAGLKFFHVRKPAFDTIAMESYLGAVDSAFRNRMILHSHFDFVRRFNLLGAHLPDQVEAQLSFDEVVDGGYVAKHVSASFHKLSQLQERHDRSYAYVFLSPIFGSISKKGLEAGFPAEELQLILAKVKDRVVAVGGVTKENILRAKELGFCGVGLLGSIWERADPLREFLEMRRICEKLDHMC